MNKRRTNQRLRRRTDLDKGLLDRGWHSGSYHKHFEGYTEYEDVNEKGKVVIRRVYTGDYYRQDLPKKKRIILRLIYAALWLVIGVLFYFCASRPVGANSSWFVAIGQLGVLVGMAWILWALVNYYTSPRDMTIGDWKAASGNLKRGTVCTALALALTAALTLLHVIANGENWGMHLLVILGHGATGALAVVFNRLEANVPYQTFPSTEPAPEDGSYIEA